MNRILCFCIAATILLLTVGACQSSSYADDNPIQVTKGTYQDYVYTSPDHSFSCNFSASLSQVSGILREHYDQGWGTVWTQYNWRTTIVNEILYFDRSYPKIPSEVEQLIATPEKRQDGLKAFLDTFFLPNRQKVFPGTKITYEEAVSKDILFAIFFEPHGSDDKVWLNEGKSGFTQVPLDSQNGYYLFVSGDKIFLVGYWVGAMISDKEFYTPQPGWTYDPLTESEMQTQLESFYGHCTFPS